MSRTLATLTMLCVSAMAWAQSTPGGLRKESAIQSVTVQSEYQAGPTQLRFLLPSRYRSQDTGHSGESVSGNADLLFVLPVEAGVSERWGDGLREIERLGLHDRHNLICVQPTFSHLPWYGDHATDKTIRQESHLVKVCVPLVDRKFRQAKTQRRLLLGFSKSGWGAMSLLLRHPNLFAKAAAWDAPFTKKKPDQFGMGPIFGTQSNFERYCLLNLIESRPQPFAESTRIGIFGYDNFREHHLAFHQRLQELGLAHVHVDGPKRKHRWDSGWIPEAIEFLVEPTDAKNATASDARTDETPACPGERPGQ